MSSIEFANKEVMRIIKKHPKRFLKLVQAYVIKKKRIFKAFREEEQEKFIRTLFSTDSFFKQKITDFLVDSMNNRQLLEFEKNKDAAEKEIERVIVNFCSNNLRVISNY